MDKNYKVALIGAGYMGKEYYKVLRGMNISTVVLGRGEEKAKKFEEEFGEKVLTGDYIENLKQLEVLPQYAIVAVNIAALATVTEELIKLGISNILVEKPVAFDSATVNQLLEVQQKYQAKVYVAYNRHFFASVKRAREIIEEDGGVSSFSFEFTEWVQNFADVKRAEGEKEGWSIANSTHVIDLAFFLGGFPKEMSSYVAGGLDWHPSGTVFTGSGISETGALFSYQANWDAPGRWVVEIMTKKHRLYFKPMEELQIQVHGSVKVEMTEVDHSLEVDYKHGLYEMVDAFFNNPEDSRMLTLEQHAKHFPIYEKITGRN